MGTRSNLVVEAVYAGYDQEVDVLKGVSLDGPPGQIIGLIGANGAGKSTLLRTICGYVAPRRGHVRFDSEDVTGVRPEVLCGQRVGYLMEGHSVFPGMSVEDNLVLGAWLWRRDRTKVQNAVENAYTRAPILKELRHKNAGVLSGGQQRILEIERLCMTRPSIILLDEPSLGLAPKLAESIFTRASGFRDEGATVVLVDQNARRVVELADHVYVMRLGQIQLEGKSSEFRGRIDEIVKEFI